MEKYDVIVLGFGKAGKTLAAKLSMIGKKVAIVEENTTMYGGTCINIGCIPTKTLLVAVEKGMDFAAAMAQKETVVGRLRGKNKMLMENAGVTLINGSGRFVADKEIQVTAGEDVLDLTADLIVINTGAVSNVLPIPGLLETKNVFDSTGIQQLAEKPARLGIIGGGNIGLEFAGIYNQMGSQVTVF